MVGWKILLTFLSRLFVFRPLTVVAERRVPFDHRRLDPLRHGVTDKLPAFRGVSHGAVQNGTEDLGALQSHVVVGLIYDEFHGDQLGHRYPGQLFSQFLHFLVEFFQWIGEVNAFNPGRLLAADPFAGQGIVFGLGQTQAINPHAGQVAAPDAGIRGL